jgi:hypothetical protein
VLQSKFCSFSDTGAVVGTDSAFNAEFGVGNISLYLLFSSILSYWYCKSVYCPRHVANFIDIDQVKAAVKHVICIYNVSG